MGHFGQSGYTEHILIAEAAVTYFNQSLLRLR